MKRLELSRLMDEYQDNEFFPEGGSAADVETVKNLVLSKAAPAKKRRVPSLKAVLLAAALTVGCVLMIAAAGPLTQLYHMASGDSVLIQTDPTGQEYLFISWLGSAEDTVILEDGRLWLKLKDGKTDITDLIDEDTPYILQATDPESGLKSYLIAGGTPEDYGWMEWFEMPLGGYNGGGCNVSTIYYNLDGKWVEPDEWFAAVGLSEEEKVPDELQPEFITIDKPWHMNAEKQLGIDFSDG